MIVEMIIRLGLNIPIRNGKVINNFFRFENLNFEEIYVDRLRMTRREVKLKNIS